MSFILKVTHTNINIGRDWLLQMGHGAEINGMTIQYCQALPRHMLQSVEIPAVTQVTFICKICRTLSNTLNATQFYSDLFCVPEHRPGSVEITYPEISNGTSESHHCSPTHSTWPPSRILFGHQIPSKEVRTQLLKQVQNYRQQLPL